MAKRSTKTTGFLLKSTKPNGPVFEILHYDPETKMGVLKGTGAEFKHSLDKEHVKQYGYKICPKENDDAEQPQVQA